MHAASITHVDTTTRRRHEVITKDGVAGILGQ